MNFFVFKWLNNISISKKLYFTVGLMALLIATELATLMFSIRTLSSVRAYVGAEGLWSKAQKDAANSLQEYGRTHDEGDYKHYLELLAVPLGDHKTRLELAKPEPDYAIARQGFIEGRVHPDDVDGAIRLFRRFHKISYIHNAIMAWAAGDSMMVQMMAIGTELHNEISSPAPSAQKIKAILTRLDVVNDQLTHVEDQFSYTLGEGSRWLTRIILRLLLTLVLTVEVCGLSLTILVSRGITRGLRNIIGAAGSIAGGEYSARATVYSRDEIGSLAQSFNDMAARLEENIGALRDAEDQQKSLRGVAEKSLEIKERFLANMSHEIRTPMNAVLGFAKLLEDTPLDTEQQTIVHSIRVSSQNLMTIINDILDYSKLETGKIELEHTSFSISRTFESLQIMLQQRAKEKKLTLVFQTDPDMPRNVIGDSTRLTQILINLGDNAIKFSDRGKVVFSAKQLLTDDETVTIEFSVQDNGEGIPADMQATIFEKFTQVSSETTRVHGGTGLGLSIVKSLVELQRGTLAVHSAPGQGSTFAFTITYHRDKSAPVKEETPLPAEKKKAPLNILIVEDNTTNQMVMELVLDKYGFEHDIAENGKIAVEMLREQRYDLVLMDIQMPIMDGYEATRIIRRDLHNGVPIIALTAHAMKDEREKCLALGMDEFISKPFDAKYLCETIIRLCSERPQLDFF